MSPKKNGLKETLPIFIFTSVDCTFRGPKANTKATRLIFYKPYILDHNICKKMYFHIFNNQPQFWPQISNFFRDVVFIF